MLGKFQTEESDAVDRMNCRSEHFIGKFHSFTAEAQPSPSAVINESSHETGVSIVGEENQEEFDKAWYEAMRHEFYKNDVERSTSNSTSDGESASFRKQFDEWHEKRTSNGYQLGLQIMALCPKKYFRIHSHPNIEFEFTMLGTLREFRWFFRQSADALANKVGEKESSGEDKKKLTGPEIAASCMFRELQVPKGGCLRNEIGSVHQSFTSQDEGCVILVLWSQCHAYTHPSRVHVKDKRLRPNVGWE